MDEIPSFQAPEPTRDPLVAELQEQVRSLRHIVKLVLVSVFVATASLSLFIYRQSTLMKRQIDAQQIALKESQAKERDVVFRGLEVFRQYATRDPVYATNVLTRFGLTPSGPTNRPPTTR